MNEFHNNNEYSIEKEEIKPEIYFHYTSLDALYSIIESQSFRLTNLASSNDAKELSYNSEIFRKDIKEIIDKETDEPTKKLFKMVDGSITNNIREFEECCKSDSDIYALCLSEKKDNLTHWDRYASGCKGVCIGINLAALRLQNRETINELFWKNLLNWGTILYNEDDRREEIKNTIISLIDTILECGKKYAKNQSQSKIRENDLYLYASAVFSQKRMFVKNASFIDENEVRLYFQASSIKSVLGTLNGIKKDVGKELFDDMKNSFLELVKQYNLEENNYYMSRYGIRSYRNLCLKEIWGSGLIDEIILGPLCTQNIEELKKFMCDHGLKDTKISVSEVPIR